MVYTSVWIAHRYTEMQEYTLLLSGESKLSFTILSRIRTHYRYTSDLRISTFGIGLSYER